MSSSTHGANSQQSEGSGYRAAEAYVRPTPIATHGDVIQYGFDLRNCTFTLTLNAPSSTKEEAPTEVFLPELHFPPSGSTVEVSGGKWTISSNDDNGGLTQVLRWWHAAGEQKITVKGVKRQGGQVVAVDVDEGYYENLSKACAVM